MPTWQAKHYYTTNSIVFFIAKRKASRRKGNRIFVPTCITYSNLYNLFSPCLPIPFVFTQ